MRVLIEYRGDCVAIPLGETVVGRDLTCGLRFNDPTVSRRHARFVRRAEELFIEDLSSANGTLLNGQPIFSPTRINDKDMVSVGRRHLKVRFVDSSMFPEVEPSTLVVGPSEATAARHPTSSDIAADGADEFNKPSRTTQRLKVTDILDDPGALAEPVSEGQPVPRLDAPTDRQHAIQRCPQCGDAVSAMDDECGSCGYSWASFRPQTRTKVEDNPLVRRAERQQVELPIVYHSETLEVEAATRDLSSSGVFVSTAFLDPVGTICRLTILVDGGPPLELHGLVCRVVRGDGDEQPGLGIQFGDLDQGSQSWLDSVIERAAADADAAAADAED